MITQIDITGVGAYTVDESTKKYVQKKIGALDRLVPRHARKSMHAEVKMAEVFMVLLAVVFIVAVVIKDYIDRRR